MGEEINPLYSYPRSKSPIEERGQLITKAQRKIARQFGKRHYRG